MEKRARKAALARDGRGQSRNSLFHRWCALFTGGSVYPNAGTEKVRFGGPVTAALSQQGKVYSE